MATVHVYPCFGAFNHSFWLHCLQTVFGSPNVRFTTSGFASSHRFWRSGALKVIVREGDRTKRIFIDNWDLPVYDEEGLAWCDAYAKTNIDPDSLPSRNASKVLPAGPTFPVRFCGKALSALYAANTLRQLSRAAPGSEVLTTSRVVQHLREWYGQAAYRLPAEAYRPGRSSSDYIFFNASLWKSEEAANEVRAMFIRACCSIDGIRFEGGFTRRADFHAYSDLTTEQSWHHSQYLVNTQTSAVAFNNPAVARCHSSRLGEYLALGKAIVSLPIERMLPAPLVHGREVHFVEPNIDSIVEAVRRICSDEEYRGRLERGAREYFLRHLSAEPAVARIFRKQSAVSSASDSH